MRERIAAELDELRRQQLFRTLDLPSGVALSSNDYLGLASDPRLVAETIRAIRESGKVGSTGSRLLAGNSKDWERAEEEFAAFAGTESALYFSSGYAANVGMLSVLAGPADVVFSDSLNHASLIDGIRLSGARKVIYPHGDLSRLEEAFSAHRRETGARLIVTESLFSMEGDFAPLGDLLALARKYGAELVVDEAHAVGVFGPGGRGLVFEAGIAGEALAVVHTCGKALASAGAFVCASREVKQYLVNRARTFIFSTAAPPYLAQQIRAALALVPAMEAERAHLHAIASALREGLRAEGFSVGTSASQIVPLVAGTSAAAMAWAESLREDGFAVRAIRPPTVPEGTARLRLSLTATLGREEIERLLGACVRARGRTEKALSARSPI
ncbi:MAG: 8-amino-7-oxononanoate synthase [Acidobacteriota bacterium]|nr:8-amino-7-oxononanoate synthase [Acidobacteriota bacterium]